MRRKPPPIQKHLICEEKSILTLSTITDKGARQTPNTTYPEESRRTSQSSQTMPGIVESRVSRNKRTHHFKERKDHRRHSPPARTALVLVEDMTASSSSYSSSSSPSSKMKRDGFSRSGTSSTIRDHRPCSRQPDSPLAPVEIGSSSLTRTTMTRSHPLPSSRGMIRYDMSAHRPSWSPRSTIREMYNPETEVSPSMMYVDDVYPTPTTPEPCQAKCHDEFRINGGMVRNHEQGKGDYHHPPSRTPPPSPGDDDARSTKIPDTVSEQNPSRGVFDRDETISQASSSIFADLDKEEESTIWGDLEDYGNGQSKRNENRRRQVTATDLSGATSERCDESPRWSSSSRRHRRPDRSSSSSSALSENDDYAESTGGRTSAGGMGIFADPLSVCVFFQDLVAQDCVGSFKHY